MKRHPTFDGSDWADQRLEWVEIYPLTGGTWRSAPSLMLKSSGLLLRNGYGSLDS